MRAWNFTAGPCTLPLEVMEKAQKEFLDYAGIGAGVIEISHRSPQFDAIAKGSEKLLRELMNIPDNYKVIFLQSGGRGEFAAVPLNLMPEGGVADYFVTGHWSRCAYKECDDRFGRAVLHECAVKDENGIVHIDYSRMQVSEGASYAYICFNETVNGIEFDRIPDTGRVPLVADMSSDILTRSVDVSKFGAIIFGVQKNVAPAGMVVAIVREDLIGHARRYCPSILDWKVMSEHDSLYNTPCVFSWYMANLVFEWIKNLGGVAELERRNIEKSRLLYKYIDSSSMYRNTIGPDYRSRVNVVFNLRDENLNKEFLDGAAKHNMLGLKGHKVLGGMRASLYNAMTIDGVKALIAYMDEFAKAHA